MDTSNKKISEFHQGGDYSEAYSDLQTKKRSILFDYDITRAWPLESERKAALIENRNQNCGISTAMEWELRLSVFPTAENLAKAEQVLKAYFAQQPKQYRHEIWYLNPADSASMEENPQNIIWDASKPVKNGVDVLGDNRGIEIGIFIENSYKEQVVEFAPQGKELKNLMLDLWAEMIKANVQIGYVRAAHSYQAIDGKDGIPTPFSYTAYRPNEGFYGLLNQPPNPYQFESPFSDLTITMEDLQKHGISQEHLFELRQSRLKYLQKHLEEITQSLREWFKKPVFSQKELTFSLHSVKFDGNDKWHVKWMKEYLTNYLENLYYQYPRKGTLAPMPALSNVEYPANKILEELNSGNCNIDQIYQLYSQFCSIITSNIHEDNDLKEQSKRAIQLTREFFEREEVKHIFVIPEYDNGYYKKFLSRFFPLNDKPSTFPISHLQTLIPPIIIYLQEKLDYEKEFELQKTFKSHQMNFIERHGDMLTNIGVVSIVGFFLLTIGFSILTILSFYNILMMSYIPFFAAMFCTIVINIIIMASVYMLSNISYKVSLTANEDAYFKKWNHYGSGLLYFYSPEILSDEFKSKDDIDLRETDRTQPEKITYKRLYRSNSCEDLARLNEDAQQKRKERTNSLYPI
jgi:hypothetical protein